MNDEFAWWNKRSEQDFTYKEVGRVREKVGRNPWGDLYISYPILEVTKIKGPKNDIPSKSVHPHRHKRQE